VNHLISSGVVSSWEIPGYTESNWKSELQP